MNFRVYVIIECPIIDKEYELLVPIDRRVHEIVSLLKKNIPEFNDNYYLNNSIGMYNKSSGQLYDMNQIIKDSDIRTGTRLLLI